MVDLFQPRKQNISLHIGNCFSAGQISPETTVKESLTVQKEENRTVRRKIEF